MQDITNLPDIDGMDDPERDGMDDPERYENLRNLVHARLIETGEIERLRFYIRQKLGAIGWKNDMIRELREVVKEKGADNITVQGLYDEISVRGRKIDQRTRLSMLLTVRHCVNKVLRMPDEQDLESELDGGELDQVSEVLTTERRRRNPYNNEHRI